MFKTQTVVYAAPAVAAIVSEFLNSGNVEPTVYIENLGDANTASIKIQESDDGMNWTDLAGATASVDPNGSAKLSINSVKAA